MNIIKRAIATDIEDISLGRVFRAIVKRIMEIPHTIAWYLPTKISKDNKSKLLSYKDKHKGQRCFIIANGPSLKKMDLSLLKNEYAIGMNRIYLLEKVNGFSPTYLVSNDINNQLKQFKNEYDVLSNVKFFNWRSRSFFKNQEQLIFFKNRFSIRFGKDLVNDKIGNGKSVTYSCLHLAYYMGFDTVILIGKDHNYNTNGVSSIKRIESTGQEDNHFIKGYYLKGMKYGVPDYKGEEMAYLEAKKAFEEDGRRIYDATVEGKLEVFEKVDYQSFF